MKQTLNTVITLVSGIICLCLIISLSLELGIGFSPQHLPIIQALHTGIFLYFLIDILLRSVLNDKKNTHIISHPLDLLVLQPLLQYILPDTFLFSSILASQIALLGIVLGRLYHIRSVFQFLKFNPAQMLLTGFFFAIFIGSLLLSLPISSAVGHIPFIDALFTATSAVCVTGLVTLDIGSTFSFVGQSIILVLMQLGGLGIMSFSAILAIFLHKKLSQKESASFQKSYATKTGKETFNIIKAIVTYTLLFECVGAIVLAIAWHGQFTSSLDHIFFAIFHAISAFCNAGFSLFSDSLVQFNSSSLTLFGISSLIIIGGLGYPVIFNISQNYKNKLGWHRLKLQSKLAINVTLLLLVAGTIFIFLTESTRSLANLPLVDQIKNAFFQSVTARTAGFNSVDLSLFHPATLMIMMSLMFIGACPGSTGGGIKTTTFGLLVKSLISNLRAQERSTLFNRSIKKENSMKAIALITISALMIPSFLILLLLSETDLAFMDALFEIVSAFATVGLSLGITEHLSNMGKGIIMVVMFIGRVGPLTVALAFTKQRKPINYYYPEEEVLIT